MSTHKKTRPPGLRVIIVRIRDTIRAAINLVIVRAARFGLISYDQAKRVVSRWFKDA